MYEHILAWGGAALLLLLCLPFSATRKLILELCTWTLRLALVALLAGGAFLWFRPEMLPAECVDVLDSFPRVRDILPSPADQTFGLRAAGLITVVLLPLLAVFDVTSRLAGRRYRRIRLLTDAAPGAPTELVVQAPAHRPDRREAADVLAQAGARRL